MAKEKITDENENALNEEVVNETDNNEAAEVSVANEENDSFATSEIEVNEYNSEVSVETEKPGKAKKSPQNSCRKLCHLPEQYSGHHHYLYSDSAHYGTILCRNLFCKRKR